MYLFDLFELQMKRMKKCGCFEKASDTAHAVSEDQWYQTMAKKSTMSILDGFGMRISSYDKKPLHNLTVFRIS